MNLPFLPRNIDRISSKESFTFSCHPTVKCFTNCCRQLELTLTPYDVLRLRKALNLSSEALFDQYIITEKEEEEVFPRFYLSMVDDGRASCVFVSDKGCTIYTDRPGACRAYPLGRAAMLTQEGTIDEFFVLIKEEHCKGFEETRVQTPKSYSDAQELNVYNLYNDKVATILQHEKIRQGMVLDKEQVDTFILALYNIDRFRQLIYAGKLLDTPLQPDEIKALADDEKLLLFAIQWLKKRLFE